MSSVTVSPSHINQQYWCHQCKKHITLRDPEEIICPDCQSEFIEEVEEQPPTTQQAQTTQQQTWNNPFFQLRTGSRFIVEDDDDVNENDDDDDEDTESLIGNLPFLQQVFQRSTGSRNNSGGNNSGSNNSGGINPQLAQARIDALNQLFANNNNGNGNVNYNGMEVLEGILSLFGTQGLVVGAPGATGMLGLNPSNTFIGNPNDYFQGGDWQAFLNRMFHETSKNGPPPAAKSEIEKLKKDKADQVMVDQKVDCAVCKDEFKWGDDYIELPCEHKYHPDCIMPWLEQHNSCPVCRFELKTDDASYEEYKKEKQEREERERKQREMLEKERLESERLEKLEKEKSNNSNNNDNESSNNTNNNDNNNNDNNNNNSSRTTTTTTTTSPASQRNINDSEDMDIDD